jgi:hypothetical protein
VNTAGNITLNIQDSGTGTNYVVLAVSKYLQESRTLVIRTERAIGDATYQSLIN